MIPLRPPRAWWGGHAQTIWSALCAHHQQEPLPPPYQRQRWDAPDGDFVDVDILHAPAALALQGPAPALVLFHGLEGSSRSHYARSFAQAAHTRGWTVFLPHFRGCSGELNRAPRAYHSGDHAEIAWILERVRQHGTGAVVAVGVSLGGNALLRWAQEWGGQASRWVRALAAVSAPLDLAVCGHALGRGFNRQVYTRMFLSTMKPRALQKWQQFPGLFDRERLLRARTLYEFDDVFTAPLHGFAGTADYWKRASSRPALAAVRVPTLLVNACNDPFVPVQCLPQEGEAGP